MINRQLTVTEVNHFIKTILSTNSILKNLAVEGEVSNFKWHSSGHLYFSLKDEGGRINCVMFKSDAAHLQFVPEDGMHVVAHGRIDVFERSGQYQVYVRKMEPAGVGDLFLAFERLKKDLEQRGWFDPRQKKPLPETIQTVGIVTALTGAAIRDMISVIHRRDPQMAILVAPALVQGKDASVSIARAIARLDAEPGVDVIIVGRGGGSMEDLWAFNEMPVAQAIHRADKPVISAVGHETDFTIADFVADLRAPTPSVAGELAAEDSTLAAEALMAMADRLAMAMDGRIFDYRDQLERWRQLFVARSPENEISQGRQALDVLSDRMNAAMGHELTVYRERLAALQRQLEVLDPRNVLRRGYAMVRSPEDGRLIKNAAAAQQSNRMVLTFADGEVEVHRGQEE